MGSRLGGEVIFDIAVNRTTDGRRREATHQPPPGKPNFEYYIVLSESVNDSQTNTS